MANSAQLVLPGGLIPGTAGLVNYVLRNSTANFRVSYDDALGAQGPILADAVLATCEADMAALISWFGVSLASNTLPVNIYVDVGSFGAYHANCTDTGLHLAAFAGTNLDLMRFLLVAELDECFMAAQGKWNCGSSSGEGLSRVLATERYPNALNGFASAPTWLDGARPNWVDTTENTDRDYQSIGCSTLFLNYLRYQLNYTWKAIIAAGAPTLAGTFTLLTGKTNGWAKFSTLVAYKYKPGVPSGVTTDNIFPIRFFTDIVRSLAWAWMIIAGGLLITPGGVFCIACGAPINVPGYIGRPATIVVGMLLIAFGVFGLVTRKLQQTGTRS